MTLSCSLTNLETYSWTSLIGSSINPISPDGYCAELINDGLRLFCIGPAYSGWLAKCVNLFLYPFSKITLSYDLMIDDATQHYGQVVETDTKITDSDGNTFDLSGQWNIAEGWRFQVGNPWVSTVVKMPIPPHPNEWTPVSIQYALDLKALASTVVLVNGTPTDAVTIPAQKLGWQPSTIITQLQQCIAGTRGAYSVKFRNINYLLEEG